MVSKIKLIKLSSEKSDIKKIKIKKEGDKTYLWDVVRKRYILETPEEWVRQEMLVSLIHLYGYPRSLIAVEKKLMVNGMLRRTDIVVHDQSGRPLILIECKAPKVKINAAAFNQIAAYNYALQVPYLVISNLDQTFILKIDFEKKEHQFLQKLPNYLDL